MRLPPLRRDGGLPLVQALARRQPQRAFTSEPLDEATLSGVPWAATVVNRPELGGRTTPSAMNAHEVVLYEAMPGMLSLYEPAAHELRRVPASQRTSYA
ncbi:MAG: SagB/ThcOx family dehydrogenase, partial [Betaproteobacteria bacterium]